MGGKKKKQSSSRRTHSAGVGSGKNFCGEAAAASSGLGVELLDESWGVGDGAPPGRWAPRPTTELEKEMAKDIASNLVNSSYAGDDTTNTQVPIPTVDVPNVVGQMKRERELWRASVAREGGTTYCELTRYGLFLQAVQNRLQEEHKRGTQKQRVAKAMADRARGEREWSQRSAALERANALVARLSDASKSAVGHIVELQASPVYVRAMAELRARDMVRPGWDRSITPAPRQATDVDDDISFEALLQLEKALDASQISDP